MTAALPEPPSTFTGSRFGLRSVIRRRPRWRVWLVPMVVAAIIAGVGWLAVASGSLAAMVATLVVIGFSPDRSELIAALTIEAMAVAAGTFILARRAVAIAAGCLLFGWLYRDTFEAETRQSIAASGALGVFDPAGWALTLASLAVTAILVGWAVATLITIARAQVVLALADLRALRRQGLRRSTVGRPALVAVVILVLAATMPVLGDMLNYEPDVDMRTAAGGRVGLADAGPAISIPPNLPSLPPDLLWNGGVIGLGGWTGTVAPASLLAHTRPWLAWRPSGTGSLTPVDVPAPFGAPGTMKGISVYTPPGYATSGRSYPVLYEVPWSIDSWTKGAAIAPTLDALIDSGAIPPVIVVFAPEGGGPFADSECANSKDGREWYASWIVQTVVPTIDTTYRTIATPAARGLIGFSQGGFCSPMLLLRNPTVFGTAISYSGYFQAGVRSSQTINAWIPWAGDAAYEASYSPIDLAPLVPQALRPLLFVELSASPNAPFFGPQYDVFSRVLDAAGIPTALFPDPLGHAWADVRSQLPGMLRVWGERMTALRVFGP